MHHTIFDTPLVNTFMRWVSRLILRLLGWKIVGEAPHESKYVLIAAPHTSNWDFPMTMMLCFALRLKVYWMGKASLFPPMLGGVMTWLGGIPVDRRRSVNLVQSTIDAFDRNQRLAVVVAPEGTRDKVMHWKTGFYYIAAGAGVPIALGYLDYQKKLGGIGKMFSPTGDIALDMAEIKTFYCGISGKKPQQFDEEKIQIKHQGSSDSV